MKAIDYYTHYEPLFFAPSTPLEHIELYIENMREDFMREADDLVRIRHAASPEAVCSIMKEQNDKWNALCRIFEKLRGVCPIKEDGFMHVIKGYKELTGSMMSTIREECETS